LVPQVFGFLVGKLKHKIFGEPIGIASNGSVQGFGLYLIELGQVAVEHYALPTDDVYFASYQLHRRGQRLSRRFFVGHP
jgi:hypothetical protein